MFRFKYSLILIVVVANCFAKEVTDIEALASLPTRCTYAYAFDMYGAHCAGLKMSKIPSLKGGIEILDFSDNKLQEIEADTLSYYTSIKYLYLSENHIYSIDKDAFAYLTYLQTLDLSKNVIFQLPETIFHLPSLRKLYLNGNPLLHISLSNMVISKPIKAPLELLDLSDCKIKELPDLGLLPQLSLYNISHNPLTTLDALSISSMCKLSKLDITGSIDDVNLCDLKVTIMWFQEKQIYFQLSDYTRLNSKEFENCPKIPLSENLNKTYNQCQNMEIYGSQSTRSTRRTWFTIAGGLAGFLVGFVLLLYIMHRHNVAQTKKKSKDIKKVPPTADIASSALLLNGS